MGEYFHYVNHDKKEKFSIGMFGESVRFFNVGRTLASRAFCLLLTKANDKASYEEYRLGSWLGDKVGCYGDHGEWQIELDGYKEINFEIIKMLIKIDGAVDVLRAAERDEIFFARISYHIISKKLTELEKDFEEKFGMDWKKEYSRICEKHKGIDVTRFA